MQNNLSNQIKETKLFEVSAFNQQKIVKIKPLYTGFQDLKRQCQKYILKNAHYLQKPTLEQNNFYPVLWIDLTLSNSSQQKQLRQVNNIFGQQISKIFQNILTSKGQNSVEKEIQEQENQFSFTQKYCQKLCLTTKPVLTHLQNKQNKMISKNILFNHCSLPIDVKNNESIVDRLISTGIFLNQTVIVNNTYINQKYQNKIQYFQQSISDQIQNLNKNNPQSLKFTVHFISKDLQSQSLDFKSNNFIHYKLKHKQNRCKNNHFNILKKIKSKIISDISTKINLNDQLKLSSFMKKCQLSARILENDSIKRNVFTQINCFTSQNIKCTGELIEKQQNLKLNAKIKEKFNNFFNQIINPRKCQLPLPDSLLRYKIQQFIKQEFRTFQINEKLQKITDQYEKKLQLQNEKQIKKILQKNIVKFVQNQISSQTSISSSDSSLAHPERINLQIRQFCQMMQNTYIFITEEHLNTYVYKDVYKIFYNRLYQEYHALKRKTICQKDDQFQQIKTLKMNNQKLNDKAKDLSRQLFVKQTILEESKKQNIQRFNQLKKINQELIVQRQKIASRQGDLSQEVLKRMQLQKQLQNLKDLLKQQKKQSKENENQKSQSTAISTLLQKSSQQIQLVEQFQNQLNLYKQNYLKLQQQLKAKSQILEEKKQFYEEKITLQQDLLKKFREKQRTGQEVMKYGVKQALLKNIQTQYDQKFKQYEIQNQSLLNQCRQHISQLQAIVKQKNIQIQNLNEQIWLLKRQTIKSNENMTLLQIKIKEKQNKFAQTLKIVQQKSYVAQLKSNQNFELIEKIKQKIFRIQLLEEQIHSLRNQLNQKQIHIELHPITLDPKSIKEDNGSFLKFQKDIKNASIAKILQLNTSSKFTRNQKTPQRKSHKVRDAALNENFQLQRLIEERKTIEKNKQKFKERQSLLNKMEIRLLYPKSEIKFSDKFSQKQGSISCLNTQNSRILRQLNKDLSKMQISALENSKSSFYNECKKKLF